MIKVKTFAYHYYQSEKMEGAVNEFLQSSITVHQINTTAMSVDTSAYIVTQIIYEDGAQSSTGSKWKYHELDNFDISREA